MKPGSLERMTDHITLQVQQVDCRVFEKTIAVPRRGAEIPEVRNHKEENPEQEECCFRFYYRPETGRDVSCTWQKPEQQKEHA
jgi:hypothetical protein